MKNNPLFPDVVELMRQADVRVHKLLDDALAEIAERKAADARIAQEQDADRYQWLIRNFDKISYLNGGWYVILPVAEVGGKVFKSADQAIDFARGLPQ